MRDTKTASSSQAIGEGDGAAEAAAKLAPGADAPDVQPQRQRRVAGHYLIGASASARLSRTAALAAQATDFPVAQINILDDRLQYTIGGYRDGLVTIDRKDTVCQFVVSLGDPLAVDDLQADARFRDLPAVRTGGARAYLGVPLVSREAVPVGTLCLLDDVPRAITDAEITRLVDFGEIVADQLDLLRNDTELTASRETSAELAHALAAGEISAWYQPIVDLETGRRVSFEALARWQRADGRWCGPADFVAVAEASDLVIDLDRAVLRGALDDLARWQRRDPAVRMNVNLSTRHLELPDGATSVLDAVHDAGVDPTSVTAEITETRRLDANEQATRSIRTLQAAGVRVVLDDFGNGWSALDWLLGLGVDGVKVDRSVTVALGTRVGDAVSRAVVGLAAELGITTTLEGIADPDHLEAARRHGFQYGQGYLWSTPVPAVAVDATL